MQAVRAYEGFSACKCCISVRACLIWMKIFDLVFFIFKMFQLGTDWQLATPAVTLFIPTRYAKYSQFLLNYVQGVSHSDVPSSLF